MSQDFIEAVKAFPCLWDIEDLEYKDLQLKEDAWKKVAQYCGLGNSMEAKANWKKLRDGHRQACRRLQSGIPVNNERPWKYLKAMEFLVPYMKTRPKAECSASSRASEDDFSRTSPDILDIKAALESSPVQSDDDDDSVSPVELRLPIKRKTKGNGKHKESHIGYAEINSSGKRKRPKTFSNAKDAIDSFFTSMSETTKILPDKLQLRIQRQVFEIVMQAREESVKANKQKCSWCDDSRTSMSD